MPSMAKGVKVACFVGKFICINGPDDVRRLMMMTDYAQLFVFVLY